MCINGPFFENIGEKRSETVKKILWVILILFLSIGISSALQQQGEISYKDTPEKPGEIIGTRVQSLIDTLNSGNPEAVRKFLDTDCTERFKNFAPIEDHVNIFLNFYDQTGGVDFESIRTYNPERPNQTVVILKDRNFGSFRAFVARFESGGESRFAGIGFNTARPPSYHNVSRLTEEQFIKELNELIKRLDNREVFSGTVLIAKGEKVLFSHASGEASKRFHISNKIDTKFNLGSMNKMFTSTAIMQLVEGGKLSLDDTLDKFLDESWLPKDVTSRITIHHLLTHTSGLGSYFNEKYSQSSRLLFRQLDDYKPLIKDDRPAFTPGERFSYSNTGMFLLGVVIEKVTGGNYFDWIRRNIAEKAGMIDTDCYDMDYPVENLAIGYSRDRNSPYKWQNNLYKHVVKGGPAGGGFSTVTDLFRFARALVSGKLVSKPALEKMWTDHAGAGYGYGYGIFENQAGKYVGHSGGFDGINSNLDIFLDTGYTSAVMSNYDMGASPLASWIAQNLARISR